MREGGRQQRETQAVQSEHWVVLHRSPWDGHAPGRHACGPHASEAQTVVPSVFSSPSHEVRETPNTCHQFHYNRPDTVGEPPDPSFHGRQ